MTLNLIKILSEARLIHYYRHQKCCFYLLECSLHHAQIPLVHWIQWDVQYHVKPHQGEHLTLALDAIFIH